MTAHRFALATAFLALVVAAAGCSCGASHLRDADAGPRGLPDGPFLPDVPLFPGDALPSCPLPMPFTGCVYCGGDVGLPVICSDGEWVCPPGTMPPERCPPTCWGPPPGGECVCDLSLPRPEWRCEETPPPPCPVVRPIGGACASEGQSCGDPCCDTATICSGGTWAPGPVADCFACTSYACGPGSCRVDEACASFGCPGDEVCEPLTEHCGECSCMTLPPDVSCVDRDGHVFLYGGDCA